MHSVPVASSRHRAEAPTFSIVKERRPAELHDLDNQALADTLEGITDLHETLAEDIRSAPEDEALREALSTRIKGMRAGLARLEARAARKRHLAPFAVHDAEIPRLAQANFTASLKQSAPKLDVIDEGTISDACWRPQLAKLDKQGLLSALNPGAEIAGVAPARMEMQFSVRTR